MKTWSFSMKPSYITSGNPHGYVCLLSLLTGEKVYPWLHLSLEITLNSCIGLEYSKLIKKTNKSEAVVKLIWWKNLILGHVYPAWQNPSLRYTTKLQPWVITIRALVTISPIKMACEPLDFNIDVTVQPLKDSFVLLLFLISLHLFVCNFLCNDFVNRPVCWFLIVHINLGYTAQ